MRPSKILREYLLPYFPQNKADFEKSEFPIYIDYSFSYDDVNNKRIVILQSNSSAPNVFIGGKELLRGNTCDIIVASKDADEAYEVSNRIFNRLRHCRGEYGVVEILPINDIEPLGINSKRFYLYTCSFGIIKED
jgi:hypothetical protein